MISANSQEEVLKKLNSIERRLQGLSQDTPPGDAQYVLMAANAAMTDERILAAGEGIALTDGGAGGNATLALDIDSLVEVVAASGDFFVYYDTTAGDHKKIDWDDLPGAGGGAPINAEYVVMALNGVLTDERVLTAGEGIALTDGGAGGNATLDMDINGLAEDAAGASGDFFVYYDTVAGDHKKIDWDDMPGGGGASYWTQVGVDIYYDDGGSATIGTIAPETHMTEGLTIYQGASDDMVLAFQSSDINKNYPGLDTDTYARFQKWYATTGGLAVRGDVESGSIGAIQLMAAYMTGSTGKTTGTSTANIELMSAKSNGFGAWTAVAANENLVRITYYTGAAFYSAWWVDREGDTFQAGDLYLGDQVASQTPVQTIRRRDANNIWIGDDGGDAWTSGDRNYCFGDNAGEDISAGFDNILIGFNAGMNVSTGDFNIAIGHDALEAGQDVNHCIAIGAEALETHNSGNGVIAIGYQAAYADGSVPQYNIYIGYEAGQTTATLGANCIAIGYHTLQANTGAENVVLGYNCMSTAGAGASNVAIGSQAGPVISSGNQNTIVGADAGDGINTGSDNVCIGYKAGDAFSSGSDNVFIGSGCIATVAARTNAIGIGKGVSVDADNKITIGNSSHTMGRINCGDLGINMNPVQPLSVYDPGTACWISMQHSGSGQLATDGCAFGLNVGLDMLVWNFEAGGLKLGTSGASRIEIDSGGFVKIKQIKSGATQVGAGAAVNDLWKTAGHASLPDNVVMIGV